MVAALAVRPRESGRIDLPRSVLSYLVGALISGFVFNRSGIVKTALAIGAAQWSPMASSRWRWPPCWRVAIVVRPLAASGAGAGRRARQVRRSTDTGRWEARDSWDDMKDPRYPTPGTTPRATVASAREGLGRGRGREPVPSFSSGASSGAPGA